MRNPVGAGEEVSRGTTSSRWPTALAAIVALGVAARAAYVLLVVRTLPLGSDASWYQAQGSAIRRGVGYVVPLTQFADRPTPTATFPPAYPVYQAAWQVLFGEGPVSVRLAGLVPAAVSIVLTGLLGRRLVGPRVGLVAAAVVALDPTLWAVDGSTMSENLTVPLVLAAVLLAHRVATDGLRARVVAGIGVLVGVAMLTRPDLALLLPLGVLPALVLAPGADRIRRIGAAGAVLALVAVVTVPWAVRNQRAVDVLTISTISPSTAIAGSNCADSYAGPGIGGWSFPCIVAPVTDVDAPEDEVARLQRAAGTTYAREHVGRLPLVLAARQARVWSFWHPTDLARRDEVESRRYGWQVVTRPIDAAFAVVGAVGLVVATRRRPDRAVLLAWVPIAVVAVSASITYGNPRFAAIAHPVLAIGLAALLVGGQELRTRRVGLEGGADEAGHKGPATGATDVAGVAPRPAVS